MNIDGGGGIRRRRGEAHSAAEQGFFADKVENGVSEIVEEFAFADTATTRVMERVMGELGAILALLRATPLIALPRVQRAAIAAALERVAGLLRGM